MEHFSQLVNNHTTSYYHAINKIPALPSREHLDLPPTQLEVKEAVEGLKPLKAPGPGGRLWNIAVLSAVATLRDARLDGAYETLQRMPRRIH